MANTVRGVSDAIHLENKTQTLAQVIFVLLLFSGLVVVIFFFHISTFCYFYGTSTQYRSYSTEDTFERVNYMEN